MTNAQKLEKILELAKSGIEAHKLIHGNSIVEAYIEEINRISSPEKRTAWD